MLEKNLLISIGKHFFKAVLLEKSQPKTCKEIIKFLPIKGKALRWGKEIYFYTDFSITKENAVEELEIGDIVFWHEGPGIGIFFGKTPVSTNGKPRAYSPASRFAKLLNPDIKKLDAVKENEEIVIELSS